MRKVLALAGLGALVLAGCGDSAEAIEAESTEPVESKPSGQVVCDNFANDKVGYHLEGYEHAPQIALGHIPEESTDPELDEMVDRYIERINQEGRHSDGEYMSLASIAVHCDSEYGISITD